MTNVMAYLAARSLAGAAKGTADDGVAIPVVRPRVPSRYETDASQLQHVGLVHHEEVVAAPPAAMQLDRPSGGRQSEISTGRVRAKSSGAPQTEATEQPELIERPRANSGE